MGILNFLPKFKIVEMNRSTGLVAGHVIAQMPLKADSALINTNYTTEFFENGFILGVGTATLQLEAFVAASHSQPFLAFTEEMNTFMDGLKYFAVEEDADGDIYPRAVGLYVGDSFTTNNVVALADATHAKVVAGVLTLQTAKDGDTLFIVEPSTLPVMESTDNAYRFTYIGRSVEAYVQAYAVAL